MYLPQAQVSRAQGGSARAMVLVVKAEADPRGIIPALRDAVRRIDPDLPLSDVRTLDQVAANALAEPRLTTILLGGFALLALTLAAIGIYGTIALLVNDREQEIGIRLALGAQPGAILAMVLSTGAALAAAGIAAGLVAAVFLTRTLENLVYGVTTHDPATFIIVPLLLGGVAIAASLLPALRAARLDPVRMLRR